MVSKMTESVSQHHMPGHLIATCRPMTKRQGIIKWSSVVPCNALRAFSMPCSIAPNNSSLVANAFVLNSSVKGSSKIQFIPVDHQDDPPGRVATSAARRPISMDLACGFQSLWPSGTVSTALRVTIASRSSCARNSEQSDFLCNYPCRV
jgi:hypothetical protein